MKILHVVAGLARTGGGTSEVVPRLCEALGASGHEIRLRTVESNGLSDATLRAARSGVKLQVFPKNKGILGMIAYSGALRESLTKDVAWADIVHLHGLWESPCWLAAWEARRQRKPYVVQPHGFLEPERLKISPFKKKIIGNLFERKILDGAARIISTAQSENIGIEKYGVRTPISIVPIGIDTADIDAAVKSESLLADLGVPRGKKVLLYFSRISPIKGLDMLAEAWARLSEFHDAWHLLIVGPDDRGYTDVVQDTFRRLLIEQATYTIHGPLFGKDKFALLRSADLFVLPTRSENFSIAVQESLAAGVPVVCTKGAPWGIVEEYGCGWWPDVSVSAIESALRDALVKTPDELKELGIRSKRMIAKLFGWVAIAQKQAVIYNDVIGKVLLDTVEQMRESCE